MASTDGNAGVPCSRELSADKSNCPSGNQKQCIGPSWDQLEVVDLTDDDEPAGLKDVILGNDTGTYIRDIDPSEEDDIHIEHMKPATTLSGCLQDISNISAGLY